MSASRQARRMLRRNAIAPGHNYDKGGRCNCDPVVRLAEPPADASRN